MRTIESANDLRSGKANIPTYFYKGIDNGGDRSQESQIMDGRHLLIHGCCLPLHKTIHFI